MDDRIRMDTAGGTDGPGRAVSKPRPTLTILVATAVTAFGLMTALAPDRAPLDPESIDPAALDRPVVEAGFRVVAELPEGPWESHRIADGYLYTGDGPTVITDSDEAFEVDLEDHEVIFGAIDAAGESVAFGRAAGGPALWRSGDNVSWVLERLPWEGTVRAAALIDGRLVLIGIARNGPSFQYVAATEVPKGWLVVETNRIPDTGLLSVPGGFVGRGTATDGSGYGYLYSDDGADWTYQSARAAAASRSPGQIPAFVVETDGAPMVTLPGDDRVFAPPAWPISGVWLEGGIIWIQTPDSVWSSTDGEDWREFPIDASTGAGNGYSVLLPVGDTPRIATSAGGRISLLRWDPGTG